VFAVWCPRHRARVLLFPASILSLHSTATGVRIRYRCTCGHEGCTPTPGSDRAAA
jgi:hypothetical protein